MLSFKSERIPRATIRRLAVYVQVLESMQRNGPRWEVILPARSPKLRRMNASQVRDLAYFGRFGVRGVGYNVFSPHRGHQGFPRRGP